MTINTLRKLSSALFISTDHIVNGTSNQDNRDYSDIISILSTLSDKNKKQAEKILTAFVEAINDKDQRNNAKARYIAEFRAKCSSTWLC